MQIRLDEAEREHARLEHEVVQGLHRLGEQEVRHGRDLEIAIRVAATAKSVASDHVVTPSVTVEGLLEDFLKEGIGAGRWKNAEAARTRDYGPIWKRFVVHACKHGLTVAAVKAYRAEVMAREQDSPETKNRNPNALATIRKLCEVIKKFLGGEFFVCHRANLDECNIGLCRVSTGQDDSLTALTGAKRTNQIRLPNRLKKITGNAAAEIKNSAVP